MTGDSFEDPRVVLARHGLEPKRAFSQNFLVSHGVHRAIADALEAREGDTVVELGPGLGTLTREILSRGCRVIAVERDRDMLAVLAAELGHETRLTVIEGDAATVDLDAIARERSAPIRVAGNLPYASTGAILRRLVDEARSVTRAVVMVQREVGDRLAAIPGTKEYGALTAFVHAQFAVKNVRRVPPGAFFPPPKVTSTIVRLDRHGRITVTPELEAVVRAAFATRRKTLRNALTQAGFDALASLSAARIDGMRRGETLSIEELDLLSRVAVRRRPAV